MSFVAAGVTIASNFTEITLRHGCSPVDLLHIFRTLFSLRTPLEGYFWESQVFHPTKPRWNRLVSHCVKSVQIRSFFWSVFSRIRNEYREIRSISLYSVRMPENTDQKKLRIWTLFTQWVRSIKVLFDKKKCNLLIVYSFSSFGQNYLWFAGIIISWPKRTSEKVFSW